MPLGSSWLNWRKTLVIRFWEKEFKQIQPKKKQSGTRKYTPQDVQQIQRIYYLLKEKGLTIEGAKKHLRIPEEEDKKTALLDKLHKVKKELERLKASCNLFLSKRKL